MLVDVRVIMSGAAINLGFLVFGQPKTYAASA
jgi:hypothetical protein